MLLQHNLNLSRHFTHLRPRLLIYRMHPADQFLNIAVSFFGSFFVPVATVEDDLEAEAELPCVSVEGEFIGSFSIFLLHLRRTMPRIIIDLFPRTTFTVLAQDFRAAKVS